MTSTVRRKAPTKPVKPARKPQLPITGFRIPPEVLEALDARVEAMNASESIARVTRNALVVHALREFVRVPSTVAPSTVATPEDDEVSS
jgi:hypothetical protein